ncbi:OLC1v1018689C2 [Oldenlandia corymbosa var. corymbosa]|uniref:OLC1v1018689C2 n=1 Tax=Oldenlandia corymbosa var. corymbosa TaxID=529605 RepID=A0AAV1ECA5_OLDCO|nr:OLC1v1018689C2 [Oldenlandia corymbosa var. corymbosa]
MGSFNLETFVFREVDTPVDQLIQQFESEWEPSLGEYSKKLLDYSCSKALKNLFTNLQEKISDGSFSRFTFHMMLAWEMPNSADEESRAAECLGKEKEDQKVYAETTKEQDETPLFYSDIMPLLVDNGPSASEDAFVWLAALAPLAADVVNARFTFEALTASTGNLLHLPAYDRFLKEIDKCVKYLQSQAMPTRVELADDEFILHVEGTASTQRVVRHIGGTNWPGRLTLTNYALYFEPSGVVTYEEALRIDLSKATDLKVKPTATGPWGAPLFDKAIIIESSELQEGVILEFPELTSSTRRDLWLALVKEIILLHEFLLKFNVGSTIEAWEIHASTILGILRLHAAREMLRMSPPIPRNFLVFALCDELPKGDYVLEELGSNLKKLNTGHPCSASTILRSLNVSQIVTHADIKGLNDADEIVQTEKFSSLDSTINQAREEAREIDKAKVTVEELKEEGIGESARVLLALLEPLARVLPWFQHIIRWERPDVNFVIIVLMLTVIYK